MDAYILPKTIAYLFLSTSSPTTLHFETPIEFMQAGKGSDFDVAFSKDKKTLVLRPLGIFSDQKNMVIISKDTHFHFKLMNVEKRAHDFVYIHRGDRNISYVKKFENDFLKIHEGESSLYLVNKTKNPLEINGVMVHKSVVLSKGLPVIMNEEVVY